MRQLLSIIAVIYMFVTPFQLFFGIVDGGPLYRTSCGEPMKRIEYVFPMYRVGCWLGAPPK
jgi:hypothetical protein